MEITNIAVLQGRNEWGPPPVLEARVEILESSALPGGEGWISPKLAEADDPRTAAARVVGQLAMTFQRLAGSNGTFVAARMAEDNVVLLALDFKNENLARAALSAAMDLYEATRDERPFPFAQTLQDLRTLANRPGDITGRSAAMFPSAPKDVTISLPYSSAARAG